MFVGHYAAALAAKTVEPRAPLWTYMAAAQLIDIGWSAFIMTGVEHMRIDPALPGSALVLYDMPWTHSLPAALIWSVAAGLAAMLALKLPGRAAAMVGAVVFSHWLGDLWVHRPDLLVWFGGPKLGFALWNDPVPEMIVEMGLIAVSGAFWIGQRKDEGRRAWTGALFITALVVLQYVSATMHGGGAPEAFARTALIAYLAVALGAWWLDRQPAPRAKA